MISIGIRVESYNQLYYCILSEKDGEAIYIDVNHIVVPLSLSKPESLRYIRITLLDIINQYGVDKAAIRTAEFNRSIRQRDIDRHYIEGVVQESLASSNVVSYVAAAINELSKILEWENTDFKQYADNKKPFPFYPDVKAWDKFKKGGRESIMVALAAQNI